MTGTKKQRVRHQAPFKIGTGRLRTLRASVRVVGYLGTLLTTVIQVRNIDQFVRTTKRNRWIHENSQDRIALVYVKLFSLFCFSRFSSFWRYVIDVEAQAAPCRMENKIIKDMRLCHFQEPQNATNRRFHDNSGTGLVLTGVQRRFYFHEMQPCVCGMHRRSFFIPVIALPMPKDYRTT